MMLPFSSVVSYHTNPLTCGVAKFSAQLAERLGVPFVDLDGEWGDAPLLSLKRSELAEALDVSYIRTRLLLKNAGVFWHDAGDKAITERTTHVFYADPSLGSPGLFCPSLLPPKPHTVNLFTFGMAGRLQLDHWRKVKALVDCASIRYHLRVSVGIHEGTSLDRVERHFDELKTVMGPEHVTILGILTDDAVSEELAHADYTVAFFEKGARANNTTIHAALAAGSGVITNWDVGTPLFFQQATKNIDQLTTWPARPGVWSSTPYTWDHLLAQMMELCAHSRSTAAQ